MPFPVVSNDILESISNQFSLGGGKYLAKLYADVKENDPNVCVIIKDIADQTIKDVPEQYVDLVFANILWAGLAVYNSLKQQSICDELAND